jgi:hypothetical protein
MDYFNPIFSVTACNTSKSGACDAMLNVGPRIYLAFKHILARAEYYRIFLTPGSGPSLRYGLHPGLFILNPFRIRIKAAKTPCRHETVYLASKIRPNEKKGVKNATEGSVKKETTPLRSS